MPRSTPTAAPPQSSFAPYDDHEDSPGRLTQAINSWLEQNEQRRFARWERKASRFQLDSWRSRPRQNLLLTAYFVGLALMLVSTITQLWWQATLLTFTIGSIMSTIAWTLLRITINSKDSAPTIALDEYEADVIHQWRTIAHNGITWGTLAIFTTIIFASVQMSVQGGDLFGIDAAHWMYTAGLSLGLLILIFGYLPAVGYVLTFGADSPISRPISSDANPTTPTYDLT